ncbi:MAG TPA: hypothetical protein VF682_05685 [Pseudomonas sp.]
MDFNEIEEKRQREHLADEWFGSPDDVGHIEMIISGLSHRMHSNTEIARYHFDLIKEIADSNQPIAKAHMVLVDCYRKGHGVDADPYLALHYLEEAISIGSNEARWWYANFLVKNEGLESVLDTNPNKALDIYRELAWDDKDISILSLSRCYAVPMLIKGKHSGQLSEKDEEMVRQYAKNWQEMSEHHYYELARFYSDGITSKDYAGPEYKQARELLILGMKKSRSRDNQQKCEDLLDQWGVKPVQPAPPTRTQKAIQGANTALSLSFVIVVIIVWSSIGVTLLAITAWINLFIGLPIIFIMIIGGIIITLRKG